MGMLEDDLTEAHKRANRENPIYEDMTFFNFAKANRRRCESPKGFNHNLTDWSTSDWFVAVLGELGEAANVAKKLNRIRDGIPGNKVTEKQLHGKLYRELGDVFVYLDLLCQSLGFSVAEVACTAFEEKSLEIGYPHPLQKIRGAAPTQDKHD